MAEQKILIIEDDFDIARMLKLNLACNHFENVRIENSGVEGLKTALAWIPDLILLDIMLPELDGFTICSILRSNQQTVDLPIILLSAKTDVSDIVRGLELGANDYVTKPFNSEELLARIRTQLRKKSSNRDLEVQRLDGLVLSARERSVTLDGQPIILTALEFDLLALLLAHQGEVFTRKQLISRLKGEDYPVTEHAVDVQVFSVRKKVKAWSHHIETVRGVGFRLRASS